VADKHSGGDNWREDALRALVIEHSHTVRAIIRRSERDPATVEDLAADVFLLAYEHIDDLATFEPIEVRMWLTRTARNLVANWVRRALNSRRMHDRLRREPVAHAPSPEDRHALPYEDPSPQRTATLIAALDAIREDYREVLLMDALGATGPAIAAALGITPVAARKRLMRARRQYRETFATINDGTGQPR
jgi:RNA polymerase sigma-70 factor (ECF subfamily)